MTWSDGSPLEITISVIDEGRKNFDDLVTSDKDNLVERLYSFSEDASARSCLSVSSRRAGSV
jgi:hypothetical protein